MSDQSVDKFFTRKEAAAYLTSIGCPTAHQTLANMASNNNAGGGPRYTSHGWRSLYYLQSDLDAWAKKRMRVVE